MLIADGDAFPIPNSAAMPWWLNVFLLVAWFGVQTYILIRVRRADVRRIDADTDAKITTAQTDARLADRRQTELEWEKLLEAQKKLNAQLRREHHKELQAIRDEHANDIQGLERRLQTNAAEIADLQRRDKQCQDNLSQLRSELASMRNTQKPTS